MIEAVRSATVLFLEAATSSAIPIAPSWRVNPKVTD
jgi:hypothetical protein